MHAIICYPARLLSAVLAFILLLSPLTSQAQAQTDDAGAPVAAPNSIAADGVGVARVSLLDGTVAVQRGDAGDSLAAALNAPILGGDYITTGDASHAEIQFDGYSQLRVGADVQLRFTHLDRRSRSLQLAAGTVDVRLMHGVDGTTTLDTPSISVSPQHSGSYRVTVTSDGQTLVTVRSGDALIMTPQGNQDLTTGTTLVAQGDPANPTTQSAAVVAFDDFDRFNADRDAAHAAAVDSAAYVNPQIDGVEDLANNGRWVTDGAYGNVWVPAAVGPDWAPYRNGRWVWEDGYGWTWVAAETWGWAPYHYGSWYDSPVYGWCWYPPQPHVYVPWRPALVAFIGFGGGGGGFSLGFSGGASFGSIGWVPLAPFEPYHPWWGSRYGGGVTNLNNITNVTNVTNITNVTNVTTITNYRNVNSNAVSSVSSQAFLQGDFSHASAVTAPRLRDAQVFRGAVPVVPTAANLRFSAAAAPPAIAVHPALLQRPFAGRPIAVTRTPFTAQRTTLATVTHAPLTPLHFRDAQTTPLPENAAPLRPAAQPAAQIERPAPQIDRPAPQIDRPAPQIDRAAPVERPAAAAPDHPEAPARSAPVAPGSTDAWSRFNQTRSTPIRPATSNAPVTHAVRQPQAERVAPPPAPHASSHAVRPSEMSPRHAPAEEHGAAAEKKATAPEKHPPHPDSHPQ